MAAGEGVADRVAECVEETVVADGIQQIHGVAGFVLLCHPQPEGEYVVEEGRVCGMTEGVAEALVFVYNGIKHIRCVPQGGVSIEKKRCGMCEEERNP